ncbi:MAG: hypothetical protein J6T10_25975 [Methanobrevibacter sp.]|nr:hypothetical protein [Methanobrevibacter sp.]
MREIEDFLKWFFNQKIIGIDNRNKLLLMGKNGIYIDAYKEYNKINDSEKESDNNDK